MSKKKMKNMRLFVLLIISLFTLTLKAQTKYLMIVDVQPQFYMNSDIGEQVKMMIEKINKLIDQFEPGNIVYIQATGKVLSLSSKGFKVIPMMPAPEIDSSLKMVSSNLFTKLEGDAFSLPELNEFFQQRDSKEIVVTGLLAEKCIYQTVMGGKKKGYKMYVVPEAIVAKSLTVKDRIIKRFVRKGIGILQADELK